VGYLTTSLDSSEIASDCFYQLLDQLPAPFLERHFGTDFMASETWLGDYIQRIKTEANFGYPRESYMLSFYFASKNLYGLPERSNVFQLNTTKGSLPYRLYSVDKFPHLEFENTNLYSGIPYIMGHGLDGSHDEAVAWVSAAETYVDIYEDPDEPETSRTVNFITEGGMMEFFILGAPKPKLV
jgi:hypothetical protein